MLPDSVEVKKTKEEMERAQFLKPQIKVILVQGYSSCSLINCFHCKKDDDGWRNCTLFLATEQGKKWRASDKGKLWPACDTLSNTIQELTLLAVTVDEDKSEKVDICLSSTDDHTVEAS